MQQCAFTSCTLDISADQALLLVAPGVMSEQKFENSEKYGALEERDGEPGGNSVWIGSLWNNNLELLTLNMPVEYLQNKNVRLSTQIKG